MDDEVRSFPRERSAEADQPEVAYRGFLFADLRGFTAFVERHGSAAAADLLDAYRTLVRSEVARHAGAEVRTEGDSFYVVFPSARRAVACGLGIVAAAERARHENPALPIRVGIGINAGETVQRDEGFVGTAVNLAARVCAHAREGEVLTTAAVRDAIGAGAGVRFTKRGTPHLKGIARPVPVFAAEAGEAGPRTAVRAVNPWLVAALAGLLVIAIGIVVGGGMPWSSLLPSASVGSAGPRSGGAIATPTSFSSPSVIAPDEFPNASERELLARFDDLVADACERADPEDRPRFHVGEEGIRILGRAFEPIQVDAGLTCEIPSFGAPDLVQLWATRHTMDFSPADVPEALIFNRAGALEISRGDCSTQQVAFDRWAFGNLGGMLLCRIDHGDAIIEWSYDDRPILGAAVRRDGDLSALLRWWEAEARLLAP